jgi:hypothetical protein
MTVINEFPILHNFKTFFLDHAQIPPPLPFHPPDFHDLLFRKKQNQRF